MSLTLNPEKRFKPLNPKEIDKISSDREFMDFIHLKTRGRMNILWAGAPMERHILTLFALRNFKIPIHPNLMFILLAIWTIFLLYAILTDTTIWSRINFALCLLLTLVNTPLALRKRKANTAYAATDEGIFFKFDKNHKARYHYLDYDSIRYFAVNRDDKYNPKLIIYPLVPVDFQTADYISCELNNFPTIEMQAEAEKLGNFLSELRVERRLKLINENTRRRG